MEDAKLAAAYKVLDLPLDTSTDYRKAKSRYNKLALQWHPDKVKPQRYYALKAAKKRFQLLNESWTLVSRHLRPLKLSGNAEEVAKILEDCGLTVKDQEAHSWRIAFHDGRWWCGDCHQRLRFVPLEGGFNLGQRCCGVCGKYCLAHGS